MVVHWPTGIAAKGELRSQWHHVIDIAPTILEAAGLPEPKSVNGTPQTPIEGVSMAYTFADAKAKSRHTTQYFEIFGNRAMYHDGWLAGTIHRAAWEFQPRTTRTLTPPRLRRRDYLTRYVTPFGGATTASGPDETSFTANARRPTTEQRDGLRALTPNQAARSEVRSSERSASTRVSFSSRRCAQRSRVVRSRVRMASAFS